MRKENQKVILTKSQTDEVVFDGYLPVIMAASTRTAGSNIATFSGFTPMNCEYDTYLEFTGEFVDNGYSGPDPVTDGPWHGVVCQSCQKKDPVRVRDRRRKHKYEKYCRECKEIKNDL